MKIAISSEDEDENSKVSRTSGRAPFYLIYDESKLVKTIKNPFRIGGGGAGFSVAQMLADENVDLVISGNFGGNMISALKEKGIDYKEVSGITVKEALKDA